MNVSGFGENRYYHYSDTLPEYVIQSDRRKRRISGLQCHEDLSRRYSKYWAEILRRSSSEWQSVAV